MADPAPAMQPLDSQGAAWFATTHWSVVLAAGDARAPEQALALERLCRTYWRPLYAFVRRHGHRPEEAQDLTQAFFARLLERSDLENVRREKGRFRSCLLVSLKRFLANESHRARAEKRGGARQVISLDELQAEDHQPLEPVDATSGEKIFERRWALTLLEQVLKRM